MSVKEFLSIITLVGIIIGFSGFQTLPFQWGEEKPYVLKPIKKVYPVYPEHLKKEGITGEVIVSVCINDEGDVLFRNVEPRQIRRHLHPELDKLAMEAVKQWKYEPINIFGKVSQIWTFISIIFDPGEYIDPSESIAPEPLNEDMAALLDKCWAYEKKYSEIADYYLCREKIREKIRKLDLIRESTATTGNDKIRYRADYYLPKLGETSRKTLFNEYQILSRDNRLREVRIPVVPPADKRDAQYELKPLSSPLPIGIPSRLFAPGFRQEFKFSLGEDKKVLGKACRTIEVEVCKKRGAYIRKATAWVEKSSYRVVKTEVEYDPSVIDERLLAECKKSYLAPSMTITYEYGVENKGFLFPSRQEISIMYDHLGSSNDKEEKTNISMSYDQYRYFSVSTEYQIKK